MQTNTLIAIVAVTSTILISSAVQCGNNKDFKDNKHSINPEIELYEKYKDSPHKQEEYLNKLLLLSIKRTLGDNFSQEKINKMVEISKRTRKEQSMLIDQFYKGSISNVEFQSKISNIFKNLNEGYKEILPPLEYKKFMGAN